MDTERELASQRDLDRERTEMSIDLEYESILSRHDPVNMGKDGLIYQMSASDLKEEDLEVFGESGIAIEKDKALKVLKVYNPGKAESEYKYQLRAHNLVEEAIKSGRDDLARVPRPADFRKIRISDDTRDRLNVTGAQLKGSEVELIMMDFVNGDDFLEIYYKWIVTHAPKDREYAVVDAESASFEELQRAALTILGMERPAAHGQGLDQEIEKRRERMYAFLKRTGFKVDETVIRQIKNTRKLLEEGGISHNDEHERNFMLEGDQVYLIDFARAGSTRPEDEIDFHMELELEQMTHGYEELAEQRRKKEVAERIRAAASDKSLPERFKSVYHALEKGTMFLNQALYARSEAAASTEAGTEDFLAVVMNLVETGNIPKGQAKEIVSHMKDSLKKPVYTRGRVTGFTIRNQAVYRKLDDYKEIFQ